MTWRYILETKAMTLIRIKILRLDRTDEFLIHIPLEGSWDSERLKSGEVRHEIAKIVNRHGFGIRTLYPIGIVMCPEKEMVDWEVTFREYRRVPEYRKMHSYTEYQKLGWAMAHTEESGTMQSVVIDRQHYYGSM